MLSRGVDVNGRDSSDDTPLHRAARGNISTIENQGHIDVVQLLLSKGAKVNTKNKIGWTPYYIAKYFERWQTAELLRQHGGHE
jgi:ankyrin repeat protein